MILNLENEVNVEAALLPEKNLLERGNELTNVEKHLKEVAAKITEMLPYSSLVVKDEWEMRSVKKIYENLVARNNIYTSKIKKELRERELYKEEVFKEAKLNICLNSKVMAHQLTSTHSNQSLRRFIHEPHHEG